MGKKTVSILLWFISVIVLSITMAFGFICVTKGDMMMGLVIIGLSIIATILVFIYGKLDRVDDVIKPIVWDYQTKVWMGDEVAFLSDGQVFLNQEKIVFVYNDKKEEYNRSQVIFNEKNEEGLLVFQIMDKPFYLKFDRKLKEQAFLSYLQ